MMPFETAKTTKMEEQHPDLPTLTAVFASSSDLDCPVLLPALRRLRLRSVRVIRLWGRETEAPFSGVGDLGGEAIITSSDEVRREQLALGVRVRSRTRRDVGKGSGCY